MLRLTVLRETMTCRPLFFSAKLHIQSWAASELKTLQVQVRGAVGINMEYIYVHAAMGILYRQLLLDR